MSENPPYEELVQRMAALENQLADYQWVEKQMQRYKMLVENATDNIWMMSLDKTFLYHNPAVETLCGYTPAEAKALTLEQAMTPSALSMVLQIFEQEAEKPMAEQWADRTLELEMYHKDGSTVWVDVAVRAVRDTNGNVIALQGSARDITDRKKVTHELVALKDQLGKELVAIQKLNEIGGQFVKDGNSHALGDQTIRAVIGATEAEMGQILIFDPLSEKFHLLAQCGFEKNMAERLSGVDPKSMQWGAQMHARPIYVEDLVRQPLFADTQWPTLLLEAGALVMQSIPLIDRSGRRVGTFATFYRTQPIFLARDLKIMVLAARQLADLIEWKHAEQALAQSEDKYRHLFESDSDALFFIDKDTDRIIEANQSAANLFLYRQQELQAMKLVDLSAESEKTRAALAKGVRFVPLRYYRKKDGTVFPVEITGSNFVWKGLEVRIASIRDITHRMKVEKEKEHLETQLRQSQRLEAVGRLAGGVAHDFNNLLSVIMGYAEMVRDELNSDHPHFEPLNEIFLSADRAKNLTRQLLAFSRKQVLEMRTVNLNTVVAGFEKLIRRVIGEDIELKLVLAPHPLAVRADTAQLEQVLMNLAVNARDAMANGGSLVIETSVTELDQVYSRKKPGVTPGRYATISISDTGSGIDQETQNNIFEPFFTTKGPEKGTGLGLATSYGIVKQHGGNIWVYSELDHGTTFNIYLPLCSDKIDEKKAIAKRLELVGGSATVLTVEDDLAVRRLTNRILQKLGYRVIESSDVTDAISQAQAYSEPIDLVLTDVVMPLMKGPEVYTKVLEHHPEAKVLYMSGYRDTEVTRRMFAIGGAKFIQKPFSMQTLAAKIIEALS